MGAGAGAGAGCLCHQSRPLRVSIPLLTEWCRGNASGTRLYSSTSGRGAALVPGCVPAADGTRPRFGILGRWHARPDPVAERACVPTWVEWMCVYAPCGRVAGGSPRCGGPSSMRVWAAGRAGLRLRYGTLCPFLLGVLIVVVSLVCRVSAGAL